MSSQPIAHIVTGYDPQLVGELVSLQQTAFPPQMQFKEPERYYEEALHDRRNINVIVRSPQEKLIAYLLALPQTEVCEELRRWDPLMREDPTGVYIDIIQTHPESRQFSGFMGLSSGVCQEARRRGHQRLGMHVRTSNGLNRVIRKILPDSRSLRRIEDWYASGEPFEYIEASPVLRQNRGLKNRRIN
jgi:hypothetical protein